MTQKANAYINGAAVEVGTISLNPGSIAAASQGTVTGTITGAKQGDQIFMTAEGLDNKLAFAGAKITADDTVTVYLNNVIDSTTAVDGASLTWDYLLVKSAAR
jgi:hypothetical protein